MTTPFSNKMEILSDLWLNYRDEDQFQDFIDYNDLGLPLAYAMSNALVTGTKKAEEMIDETFSLLITALDIEDIGFENLDQMFEASEEM